MTADHSPDSPFGCTRTWGNPILYPDMGLHVCNLDDNHAGPCACKCGSMISNRTTQDIP